MRSSASTPSPPEPPIHLGILLVGDDHARACTGRRLIRQGLAQKVRRLPSGPALVLDPYAPAPLCHADLAEAVTSGIVAVDCSWNRLSAERGRHPTAVPTGAPSGARRLPMLVAANPQHFGRVGELNTAEALAAALVLVGRPTQADRLLAGFAGGPTFLEINRTRLARYARARTPAELLREERALFAAN